MKLGTSILLSRAIGGPAHLCQDERIMFSPIAAVATADRRQNGNGFGTVRPKRRNIAKKTSTIRSKLSALRP